MEALVGGGDLDAIDSLCLQTGGAQHRTGGRTRSDLAHQRGGRALPSHGQRSWPHWELFDGAAYVAGGAYYPFAPGSRVAPVLSARGCPYSCNFCFQPSPYGTRELDDVFDEMQWLIERYRLDGFYVEDDLFMLDRRRVLAFCQGLMRRGIRTRFTVTGRFNIVDAELLTALREAGCVTVFYGGESADQDVLDDMKKKTTVEQMRQGVELTRAHGLFTRVGFMFGQPHDTRETLEQTVSFLTEIAIGHFEPRYIYGCVPFPATELFDHCVRHGLLRDHEDLYRRFEFKERLLDQLPVNMTAIRDVPVKQLLDDANARLARIYSERSGEWLQFFREAPAPPPSAARRPSLSVVP
jgi:radical SAM superfamily enzyme YgiQ (UPF0313 family)